MADAHTTDEKVVQSDMEKTPSQSQGAAWEAPSDLTLDPAKERKLLAKLDLAFVPIIAVLYLTCFLDRSNIGNVRVAGMPEDIGASTNQFSAAVSIFYATYVTFETPLAILLKKLTPKVLLAGLCTVWSLVTIFSGFVQNPGGLYATRLLLGCCEAGLFPGLTLYLTMVYKREELAKRIAYLFSCTALSGAFGGLLAYALLQINAAGYPGWRWVYIIEGCCSIIIAPIVWFGLPTDPSQAWFLNPEEKEMMLIRRAQASQYQGSDKFDWREAKIALRDPKVYLSGIIQFCQDIVLYGFSTFLPSILRASGYNSLQSNYLTIPVYVFGALMFYIAAYASDRLVIRSPFLFAGNIIGIIGYIILLTVSSNGVKYFATYLIVIAYCTGPGTNMTWLSVNFAPHYRRATAVGFQQTIGNTAGIVAGQIYREAPYVLGHSFSLGALVFSQIMVCIKVYYIWSQNKTKEKIASGEIEDTRKVRDGDRSVDFKYHL